MSDSPASSAPQPDAWPSTAPGQEANGQNAAPGSPSEVFQPDTPPAGSSAACAAAPANPPAGVPSTSELEGTLQRIVKRVAMMIQAEKCVFLLRDADRRELAARPPSLGLAPEEVRSLRLPINSGLSGKVFQSGQPLLVNDISAQPADLGWLRRLDVRNLIAYPLFIEHRDEQERVTERVPVGVLHVINKRGGGQFSDEDLQLLTVMARQVAAVITNAQMYLRLNEEKEQLQATLQSLVAGVVMVDSDGHIVLLNPAAEKMFGLQGTAVTGQHFADVLGDQAVINLLQSAVSLHEQSQAELEITPQDAPEPRIFQGQTTFVHDQAATDEILGVVAIFNDITEIRNVERMKTAFVSTVSHELRTPLTSIKGFISTLREDREGYYDLPENQELRTEFYEIIDSECDRLRRLIEDLLNVSRIESGRALQMNWSEFDPLPVIERVIQAQKSYTDKHPLRVEVQGTIPHIIGDSDKLDQIMTNLVSNAIKYSPMGGDVTTRVRALDGRIEVAVSDQGIGIPSNKLHKVFDKFERIDNRDTRQAGGTGIGLFLVKHLVERHEGTIRVESELGQGSTFTFYLPLCPKAAKAEMAQFATMTPRGGLGGFPPKA